MNDISIQVRQALADQAAGLRPPPIDHEAFAAVVGCVRRRRRVLTSGVAGMAAVCAVIAGYAVLGGPTGPSEARLTPATSAPSDVIAHPPFLLAGQGLVAGVSQDNSYGASSVDVGHIEDVYRIAGGLLLVGQDSRLFRTPVESEGDPVDAWTMGEASTLREDPVQSLVVSRDGRSAAWITLDDHLEVYDLVHDELMRRTEVSSQARLFAVSGDAVLMRDPAHGGWGDQVHLETDGQGYALGRMPAGPVESADLTSDTIELTAGSVTAFIPRTSSGAPSENAWSTTTAGAGQLSPDGTRYLAVTMEETADGTAPPIAVWDTAHGARSDFSGLPRFTGRASWLDDETVLLSGGGEVSNLDSVYVCSVTSLQCGPVLQGSLAGKHVAPMVPSSFVAAP